MASFSFTCSECGARYAEREVEYVCPPCAAGQRPGGATRGVLEVVLAERPLPLPELPLGRPDRLARYLPVAAAALPPVPVGDTPLLPVPRLRAELGMPRLWVKDDTRNPSGSTKDRASLLVVAKAVERGCDTVACASTGNAATALACLAAAAGVRAVVFVPAAAPAAKLVQIASYGALLVPVAGSYDDAFELSLVACAAFGWYNRNTAYNPFTIEGKKTVALEIAAELWPERADVVLVPTGDGVIVSAVAKGFAEVLPQPPRLIAVQPAGSAAIAATLRGGGSAVEPVAGAASVADSLVVGAPRNGAMAVARVRASGGTGVVVEDDAILAAIGHLARRTGVFAEPAAAAALAGLLVALEEGRLGREERVVLLVTGSGLKDIPAAARTARVPPPIKPTLAALEARLGERAAG